MIDTGLDDLLGGLVSNVYPTTRPLKSALPCIVWRQISGGFSQNHDGPTGIRSPRIQFTAHADSALAAATLASQIIDLLDGYSGPVGTSFVGNVEVANQITLGYFENTKSHQVAVDAIFHTER
jgi:hypothetical protein